MPIEGSMDTTEKSLMGYKMATVGLAGLLIGGLGGFFVGQSTASSGSSEASASAPAASTGDAVASEPVPTEDTAAGWSEEGQVMQLPEADLDGPLPVGVNNKDAANLTDFGWNYNEPVADKPEVVVWEDFQCPACAAWETASAPAALMEMADAGEINLVFRPLIFLDMALQNDSSQRATAAWGCAIDAGVGEKYRRLVFTNQPAQEGVGYTEADLISGGKIAGLEGEAYTAFEDCVKAGTYSLWGPTSSATTPKEIGGTPSVTVNGSLIEPPDQIWEADTIKPAIEALTK